MSSAEFKGKAGLVRLWNALGYTRDGLENCVPGWMTAGPTTT